MKKSKIIITFTLIITSLFLSGCGIFTKSKSNGLIFRDIDSNTCEVIGYEEPISKKISEFITRFFIKEKDNDIVIPSEYKGKKVVSIGEGAFADFYNLKSIVIPESVISIGDNAFGYCSSLESIVIPDSVTSIGDYAFSGCRSLTNITIPESVTSIGDYAFYWCDSLTNITIQEGVTSIGKSAFMSCTSLESIVIPDSVTSIGDTAFYECSSLESIIIPDSVTSIGYAAFSKCSSLESMTLPFVGNTLNGTTNTHFGYIFGASSYNDHVVPTTLKEVVITGGTSIGLYAFSGCSSLESIIIPEGVTSIEYGSFSGCSSLESIVIPESVANINRSCFSSNLKSVYYSGTINDWCNIIFYGLGSNPMNSAEHFYMKDSNNEYYEVTEIEIPNTVTSIGYEQFSGFDNITTIVIPDSVTIIGAIAFSGCSSLESIIIPESVTSIGSFAFSGCSSLESIVIPDSVTSIGSSVFSGCDRLIIYCETESQPSGWDSNWNSGARPVIWGHRN